MEKTSRLAVLQVAESSGFADLHCDKLNLCTARNSQINCSGPSPSNASHYKSWMLLFLLLVILNSNHLCHPKDPSPHPPRLEAVRSSWLPAELTTCSVHITWLYLLLIQCHFTFTSYFCNFKQLVLEWLCYSSYRRALELAENNEASFIKHPCAQHGNCPRFPDTDQDSCVPMWMEVCSFNGAPGLLTTGRLLITIRCMKVEVFSSPCWLFLTSCTTLLPTQDFYYILQKDVIDFRKWLLH